MQSRFLASEQMLALLAETPPRLAALSAALSPEALQRRPTPEEWSANEVLAHLRACADVWGTCIRTMLAQDMPMLRAVNPRTWIKRTDYPNLDFQPSLDAFARQRAELLAVLEALPPECWHRVAIVTGAGKVLQLTVLSYAERLARHERAHVKQVGRILTALHREH
jgi:DinB superfamily